ncbi:uncharacterized protein LOC122383897 [Amphibalanus amphitrite]|uniref:uncharacterized protein LOC122383897 n=1 Tax=Amphibalanus amphitrite TaxID=1232801 RepID=UPI001C926C61|nr:uncharacterized protein LOC122383897 [Amphibalanus amphitrite]
MRKFAKQRCELFFDPLEPVPRVFAGAPAGQLVTQVYARDLSDPSVRPTYSLPQGADFAQFRLNTKNGRLYTRRPVKRRVNDTYELAVIAYGGGESRVQQISVLVSEKNIHPPKFTQTIYSVEVPVNAVAGTPLVRIRATDNDTVSYNRQLVYSITASDDTSRYLSLDSGSGQITLRRPPPPGLSALNVTVSARDLGSPAYRDVAGVQITFRTISEPEKLRTVPMSDTSVMVCWRRPRLGVVSGYLMKLTFEESTGGNITRLVRRHSEQLLEGPRLQPRPRGYRDDDDDDDDDAVTMAAGEQCTLLDGLQPWTTYHLVVHGYREHETGMASESITFGTRRSPCSGSVCGPGTCRRSGAAPGYNCYCPEGTFGQRCELRDPCFSRPCQNLGVCHNISSDHFECSCMAGFHGETCADFNPCLSHPPPCQNGGTCYSDASNKYSCICPPLYTGDTCDRRNPCQESTCNNGTCHEEDDTFYCDCDPGYTGDHCELKIDHCASSPCKSGATCVGGATGFTCHCTEGFTGDDCGINIDDCASQPCKHGGVCSDGVAEFVCTCPDGYAGHLCQTAVFCPSETVDSSVGLLEWPETPSGRKTLLPCPAGGRVSPAEEEDGKQDSAEDGDDDGQLSPYEREDDGKIDLEDREDDGQPDPEDGDRPAVATRRCLRPSGHGQRPLWEEADTHLCRDQRQTALAQSMSHRLLRSGTTLPTELDAVEFSSAAQELTDIMPQATRDTQVARSVLQSVSQLMESSSAEAVSDRHAAAAAGRLARALELMAVNIELDDDDDDDDEEHGGAAGVGAGGQVYKPQRLDLSTPNVAFSTLEYLGSALTTSDRDVDLYPSLTPAASNGTGTSTAGRYPGPVTTDRRDPAGARVRVPASVLRSAGRQQRRLRLVVISYRTSRLFPAHQERTGPDPGVITVTIPGYDTSRLMEPVKFGLGAVSVAGFQPRCVYWKENEMSWSEEGVTTELMGDQAVCSTSHLSSFSVLFDPVAESIGGLHERILSILSYIGAGLSLLGLALTILTYSLFRCLSRERQGKILLNLCASLLLMNVMFLVSNLRVFLPSTQFCITTAVLVHYLVLTSLCWMLVEAINMYQLIITVFATSESSFMLKRLLFAWGLPAAVVLSALISDRRMYYEAVDDHYCVISAKQPYIFYISFFGPGCVILIINVIVFVMVSRVLFQQRTLGKFGAVRKSISFNQVRGAFTVMALLGVSWIFGAFALGRARIAFSYIFTILNSMQGFIIFVSRCVQYPEARLAWLTLIKTGRRKQRRGSAPGSSSQTHKKSSLPSSRAAVNSVTYSLSSSSEGGWPGRPDAWRATGPRHRGSQPERSSQPPPPEPPEPAPPSEEPRTEPPPETEQTPGRGERQRRSERLPPRPSDESRSKEGDDTSWQFVRAAGSTSDLAPDPPQTFNVMLNQAGGERLRRSVSVGLPPASAPLSPRHRYRSHGDVTRPARSDVTFCRPDAYDERELPLRRSHWDPLNYGSGQRHGRTETGLTSGHLTRKADRGGGDCEPLPPPPDLVEESSLETSQAELVSDQTNSEFSDGGRGGRWSSRAAGTDTLVSRSRLSVPRPEPPDSRL